LKPGSEGRAAGHEGHALSSGLAGWFGPPCIAIGGADGSVDRFLFLCELFGQPAVNDRYRQGSKFKNSITMF